MSVQLHTTTRQIDVASLTDTELTVVVSDRYIAWVRAIGTPHADYLRDRYYEANQEWTTRANEIKEKSA